jgi:thiol-disulfide isomerase/thioredoxin
MKRHFVLMCLAGLGVGPVRAQSESTLKELQKLHASLNQPGVVVTQDDGKKAEGRLLEWGLTADTMSGDAKRKLLAVEALAAAATGDAAKAGKKAAALIADAGDDVAALEAAYCGASAAGDAQVAEEALKKLSDKTQGEAKKSVSRRRSWIAQVGREAPDVSIATDDVKDISPRKRGDKVLLLDFWNTLAEPPKEHIERLKKLHAEFQGDANIEFVGINAESESRLDKAKEFAKRSGFAWPQRYEGVAIKAPITHEAFKAGQPPWVVLIDSYGFIRAVGAPGEPGFDYALRAALAEARGDFPPVMPRTRDGKQAKRESQTVSGGEGASKPGAAPASDLPSNPEARKLLQEAHAMRRTGMKTKSKEMYQRIISEYPGTKEAKEAQEWID